MSVVRLSGRVRSIPRWTVILYWTATTATVAESLIGGVYDLLHLDPFFPALAQLGYPAYLATIMGAAKILAGLTVAAPRVPRLKEWAYAGIVINMIGASASWIAIGHGPSDYLPPLMIAAIGLTSWATRSDSRRLPGPLV